MDNELLLSLIGAFGVTFGSLQTQLLLRRRNRRRMIALLQSYRYIRNTPVPRGIQSNIVQRILELPTLLYTHCRINHDLYDLIR
jgi:hypothetical protein